MSSSKKKVANSDSGSRNGKMGSSSAVGSGIAHCHLELEGWDRRGRVVTFNFGLMQKNALSRVRRLGEFHNFTTSLGKWKCAESRKGVRMAMSRGIKPSMAPCT